MSERINVLTFEKNIENIEFYCVRLVFFLTFTTHCEVSNVNQALNPNLKLPLNESEVMLNVFKCVRINMGTNYPLNRLLFEGGIAMSDTNSGNSLKMKIQNKYHE